MEEEYYALLILHLVQVEGATGALIVLAQRKLPTMS
jgi:hypothetical protein